MKLHDAVLERLQELSHYGDSASGFQIRREVLKRIESGADAGDVTLISLRKELWQRFKGWKDLFDYQARRAFFETYCEATFYLSASRSIELEAIPTASVKTPDFRSPPDPEVCFELKTLDISDPQNQYPDQQNRGFDSTMEAREQAKCQGIGFSTLEVTPHGSGASWTEVMTQTMRKISGNVKKGQYTDHPTFLVMNLSRVSPRLAREHLQKVFQLSAAQTFYGKDLPQSGHLWTLANHHQGSQFHSVDHAGRGLSETLDEAGVLIAFPFIQGVIFTCEPWSEFHDHDDWRDSYRFYGVWNTSCSESFSKTANLKARTLFDSLCQEIIVSD